MRRHLRRALADNQNLVEDMLRYDLTPQYHEEEMLWDGRSRIRLE
jgi:hypothetical protein